MDAIDQLLPTIQKHKDIFLKGVANADEAVSDKNLRTVAVTLHTLLPFPVRMVVKKDTLASLLIANRAKLRALL